MKPHRFNVAALLLGLAFVLVGVLSLVQELTDHRMNAELVAALGFVALGVVALVATLTQRAHHSAVEPEHPDA